MKKKSFAIFFFFLFTGLFWLLIIQYLGIYKNTITPRNGVLSYTFNWWESTTISKHLFLGNYIQDESSKGTIYTTYTYPFYFINYFLLVPFHFIFNTSYEKLQNLLPYFNVLLFFLVIYQLKKQEIKELYHSKNSYYKFWIFLVFGVLITNALPWVSMLRHNQENLHMPVALLFCVLSLTILKKDMDKVRDNKFLFIGSIIACISPIYFPAWVLCYIYSETELKLRKAMVVNVIFIIFIHFINYIVPLLAAKSLNLKSSASGYLYRSGLDGSTDYFNSILSVIYNPSSEQHTTSTIILIVSSIFIGRKLGENSKMYFKQLIFTFIPFCTTVFLFPQFSSIHMYLIEFLLVIPPLFLICYWLLNSKLVKEMDPQKYTNMMLFFLLLIMSQLLEIAKYFKLNHFIKEIIT